MMRRSEGGLEKKKLTLEGREFHRDPAAKKKPHKGAHKIHTKSSTACSQLIAMILLPCVAVMYV